MHKWRVIVFLIGWFGVMTFGVFAREVLQGTACTIAPEETVNGTLFVLCENLTVEGVVNGNIIGLALRATLNGQVTGNVYLAGGELDVNGELSSALHYAGVRVLVKEGVEVGGSLFFATLQTTLAPSSVINGNVIGLGYELNALGDIAQEVNFWGAGIAFGGNVGGNVYANVGDPDSDASQIRGILLPFGFDLTLGRPGLRVLEGADIAGDVRYGGISEGVFEGVVRGDSVFTRLTAPLPTLDRPATLTIFWNQAFSEFTALAFVGFVGWMLVPTWLNRPLSRLRLRSVSSFSVGLLTFLLSFPIVLIVLFLSLTLIIVLFAIRLEGIAVAVGILLLALNSAGIGGFYFLAIYVGRVLVAWAFGRLILSPFRNNLQPRAFALASLLAGTAILGLAIALPVIGWIVNAIVLFLGLGTLLGVALNDVQEVRDAPAPPLDTPTLLPSSQLAVTPALGMANLPDGFNTHFFDE